MASQEERDRIMAEYMASVDQDDDDDDDDEADFQPGMDEEDDDDDDDEALEDDDDDEDDISVVWKGDLTFVEGKLTYSGKTSEGDSFTLVSSGEPLKYWNWNKPTCLTEKDEEIPRMRTIVMEKDKESDESALSKKVDMTFTSTKRPAATAAKGKSEVEEGKKSASNKNDDDDGKKMASSPSSKGQSPTIITVYCQGSGFELYGEFSGSTFPTNSGSVVLECRYQKVVSQAAATAAAGRGDDDDDNVDVDEGVDFNELIALHQDAGMPVTELRKRYRSGDNTTSGSANNNGHGEATAPKKYKGTAEELGDDHNDDDDDDEEIGF